MLSSNECICCCELHEVAEKMQECSSAVSCIINHVGFRSVCLDVWVLQTANYAYQQRYGVAPEKTAHE